MCLQRKNICKLGEIRGSFTISMDCDHYELLNTHSHHSGCVSKVWHDVALRGKTFMLGFFDLAVESSVQEPSLAAAKGRLGLQQCFHLAIFDLPEVTLSLYLHII